MTSSEDPLPGRALHRRQFLDSARVLLAGQHASGTLERLGQLLPTQLVVDDTGLKRTNLYRAFPATVDIDSSHDRFVREVFDDLMTGAWAEVLASFGSAIENAPAHPSHAAASIETATADLLERLDPHRHQDPQASAFTAHGTVVLLGLAHPEDDTSTALRSELDRAVAGLALQIDRVLEAWDSTLVEPVTTTDLARLILSLILGELLWSRVRPQSTPPEANLGMGLAAVIGGLLVGDGDERSINDQYVVIRPQADRRTHAVASPASERKEAKAISQAARDLFVAASNRGEDPRRISVADIASAAGSSIIRVERLFGSASLLLIDTFYNLVETAPNPRSGVPLGASLDRLATSAEGLRDPSTPPGQEQVEIFTILGQMLLETAEFATANRTLATAALAVIEFGTESETGDLLRDERDERLNLRSISSRFARVIDIGQELGVLRDETGLNASELGNLLPVSLLHQTTRKSDVDPRHLAEVAYATLVRGLASEPQSIPSPRAATRGQRATL